MRRRTWAHGCVGALLLVLAVVVTAVPPVAGAAPAADSTSATARASVDDASVSWGQTTTVRGPGWAPGQIVKVILYAGGHTVGSARAGTDGSVAIPITIPSGIGSSNKYRLAVQGPGGDGLYGYVEVPITIAGPTPTIAISSSTLRWRETATVSGRRYKSGTEVTISLFPDNVVLGKGAVAGDDTFSTPITIPPGLRSAKDYQLAVTGEGIDLLFHFDVLPVTIVGDRPTIHLSSTRVARGASFVVSGDLFLKGTTATITLLPGYEKLGKFDIQPDGTFSAPVRVPERAGGVDPHAIVVTGQGEDGILAYVTAKLDIGGSPPKGKGGSAADVGTDSSATPPSLGPDVSVAPGGLGDGPRLRDPKSAGRHLPQILLILLLILLAIIAIVLTSRRDVREALRRRKDELLHRLHLGRTGP